MYVNGTLVKGIPALKDNFIETTFGSDYLLRFDNISFNVPKDGSADVVVKATTLSNPENTTTGSFTFPASAFRGRDGKGLDQYAGSAIITGTATQVMADASTGTLTLSLNQNSPKTGFVIGHLTNTTSDQELAKFDIKGENRDVTIKSLNVTISDHGTPKNQLISAVKLFDGSTLLASVAYTAETATDFNGDGDTADLVARFTNLNISVAKDSTKTLTVKVDLKPIDGTTIVEELPISAGVNTNATAITAVDSNDNMLAQAQFNSNTNSAIVGKTITAYTKAPTFALSTANIVKTTQAGSADVADATLTFNVTANGGDIYVNKTKEILPTSTAITTITETAGGSTIALVTSPTHGLTTGQQVTLKGTAAYDGTYTITVVSPTTFSLGAGSYVADAGAVGSFSR